MTLKQSPSEKRRVWPVICILLLVLILCAVLLLRVYYGKLNVDSAGRDAAGSMNPSGITNILLIGVDNDYAEGMDQLGNADGLVIVSVNEKTHRIVLTSLMRDIRVQVPDAYRTKLTLVYHEGGVPLLIDTIEQNFGIAVDAYVLVNYLSVIQVVDKVGGIPIELTGQEVYYMDEKIQNLCTLTGSPYEENRIAQPDGGLLMLNGLQTAAYLRVRYAGNSDFERTERARRVLLALRDKVKKMDVLELRELLDTVLPCVTTDMSPGMLLTLAAKAPGFSKFEILSDRIPIEGTFWFSEESYGSFLDIDFESNRQHLQESIYSR